MDGKVVKMGNNGIFQVELDDGKVVNAHMSGKLRMNFVRIKEGDRVTVETSPQDESKGRITYRYKPE